MRTRQAGFLKAYEYGDCTVFVQPSSASTLDGLVKGDFTVQVHPVRGEAIEMKLHAYYCWDAANRARDYYNKTYREGAGL